MRRTPALISALAAAALLSATLAGCSASGGGSTAGASSDGCTPAYGSGDASKLVTATGKIATQPKVKFPTPLVTKGDEVSTIKAGKGAPAARGAQVDFEYSVYDASTGETLGGTGYETDGSTTARAAAGAELSGQKSSLSTSLLCVRTGERFALTTTAKASYGKGALEQYGIKDSDTLVIVTDVLATYLGKANGSNQLPKDGMPNVVTAVNGQPGIVLQELTKPTSARSEVVKAGSGTIVKKSDKVVMNFTAFTWPTGSGEKPAVVDALDTWSGGQAATIPMETVAKGGSLPDAIVKAIIGQKIGSQVLVVLPPKDGFPKASLPTGVTATDTTIFVIDLLGIDK